MPDLRYYYDNLAHIGLYIHNNPMKSAICLILFAIGLILLAIGFISFAAGIILCVICTNDNANVINDREE